MTDPEILPPAQPQPQPAAPQEPARAAAVEDAQTAAEAQVAPLLSGALVTATQERAEELARRILEHRAQTQVALAGLPLLDHAARYDDHTPDAALQILKGGVYRITHGAASVVVEIPFTYRDAETGALVSATCALTYEPADHQITREALEVYLFSLRRERLTASHAASLIGFALWGYLIPFKLKVNVKPASLRERGAWERSIEGPPGAFSLEEEVLRASLLLHVPQLIERAQRKGGPSRLELDDAGNKALELLGRVRSGAYAITGPDSLVPLLLEAVAIAAFEPQGIRCLGLYFQAEAPHSAGEQTDFEDYARAKATE